MNNDGILKLLFENEYEIRTENGFFASLRMTGRDVFSRSAEGA